MKNINSQPSGSRLPSYFKEMGVYIPHALNLLIDVVGYVSAMEIVLELGGRRVRIPVNPTGSKLEEIVGSEAARKISGALGEEVLEMPLMNEVLAIYLMRECGWNSQKVANRLRISRRKVQYIRAGDTPVHPFADDEGDA